MKKLLLKTVFLSSIAFFLSFISCTDRKDIMLENEALKNGIVPNEGFRRSMNYVHRWLELADSTTDLIPENICQLNKNNC